MKNKQCIHSRLYSSSLMNNSTEVILINYVAAMKYGFKIVLLFCHCHWNIMRYETIFSLLIIIDHCFYCLLYSQTVAFFSNSCRINSKTLMKQKLFLLYYLHIFIRPFSKLYVNFMYIKINSTLTFQYIEIVLIIDKFVLMV